VDLVVDFWVDVIGKHGEIMASASLIYELLGFLRQRQPTKICKIGGNKCLKVGLWLG